MASEDLDDLLVARSVRREGSDTGETCAAGEARGGN